MSEETFKKLFKLGKFQQIRKIQEKLFLNQINLKDLE